MGQEIPAVRKCLQSGVSAGRPTVTPTPSQSGVSAGRPTLTPTPSQAFAEKRGNHHLFRVKAVEVIHGLEKKVKATKMVTINSLPSVLFSRSLKNVV